MNSTLIASYSIIALYCVLALTGLIGNTWVMLTVIGQLMGYSSFSFRSLRRSSKAAGAWNAATSQRRSRATVSGVQFSACIYLLLLSVVDLVSFVPVPLLAADIIENRWPFGIVLCKLLYTCEGANKSLSPLVLTALSVDRYIAVCRPNFIWLRQSRFALVVIVICTLISSLFILPVTLKATVSVMADFNLREHRKCVVQMDKNYDIFHTVTCYVLPLIFICSVYVAILRRLYRHTRTSTVGRRTSISLSRVVKCSVLVVAFYFICWTPYWTMRIISIFSLDPLPVDELPSSASAPASLLASPSSPIPSTPINSPGASTFSKKLILFLAENVTGGQPTTVSRHLLNLLPKAEIVSENEDFKFRGTEERASSNTELSLLSAFLRSIQNTSGNAGANNTAQLNASLLWKSVASEMAAEEEQEDFLTNVIEDYRHILLMYLVHALPYTQSAFNWLFYAFLNRNLRQSARCSQSARSGVLEAATNGNSNYNNCQHQNGGDTVNAQKKGALASSSPNAECAASPLCGSIDRMFPFWRHFIGGAQRKTATQHLDHNGETHKRLFFCKPRIRSRSATYVEVLHCNRISGVYSHSTLTSNTPNITEVSSLMNTTPSPNSAQFTSHVAGGEDLNHRICCYSPDAKIISASSDGAPTPQAHQNGISCNSKNAVPAGISGSKKLSWSIPAADFILRRRQRSRSEESRKSEAVEKHPSDLSVEDELTARNLSVRPIKYSGKKPNVFYRRCARNSASSTNFLLSPSASVEKHEIIATKSSQNDTFAPKLSATKGLAPQLRPRSPTLVPMMNAMLRLPLPSPSVSVPDAAVENDAQKPSRIVEEAEEEDRLSRYSLLSSRCSTNSQPFGDALESERTASALLADSPDTRISDGSEIEWL